MRIAYRVMMLAGVLVWLLGQPRPITHRTYVKIDEFEWCKLL